MKNRIKQIRKDNGLTQVEFGERIGVKGNTITNYETGLRNPTDAVILSICREFDVSEEWLRTGNGQPTIKRTRSQEIGKFASETMKLPDENIKNRLIAALAKLDERDWETIAKIADSLKEGD